MSEVGAERGRMHPVMHSAERRDRERMIHHVRIKLIGAIIAPSLSAASEVSAGRSLRRRRGFTRRAAGQSSCSSTSSSCLIKSECPSPLRSSSSAQLSSSAQRRQKAEGTDGQAGRQTEKPRGRPIIHSDTE